MIYGLTDFLYSLLLLTAAPLFLCPSVSILACDSLFPSPLFHSVCDFASLSPLLSLLLSSLHHYPKTFIFRSLPTFTQFFSPVLSAFSLFPLLQIPLPPFPFQSRAPHYYLTAMLLYRICYTWCFHILLAYGELSLLLRSVFVSPGQSYKI